MALKVQIVDASTGAVLAVMGLTSRFIPAASACPPATDKDAVNAWKKANPNRPFDSGKTGYNASGKIELLTADGAESKTHQVSFNLVEIGS